MKKKNVSVTAQSVSVTAQAAASIINVWPTKRWDPRKERSHLKIFWDHDYYNWSETEIREHRRVDREKFELVLNKISTNTYQHEPNFFLETRSNNIKQIKSHMFFRATCSLFELSIGSAVAAFNTVSREMISALFNEYVYMPMSE